MSSIAASLGRPSVASTPGDGSLQQVQSGQRAKICRVRAQGVEGDRLLEMGLTAGTEVKVLRRSLFGHAVHLSVRNSVISLGGALAAAIDVLPLAP